MAFRYQLFAAGAPMKMDKLHFFCLKPLKTICWNLKDEVPLNFQKSTQRPNITLISIQWYYFWPTLVFVDSAFNNEWLSSKILWPEQQRRFYCSPRWREKNIFLSLFWHIYVSWRCPLNGRIWSAITKRAGSNLVGSKKHHVFLLK
jgi:hypothetical protein